MKQKHDAAYKYKAILKAEEIGIDKAAILSDISSRTLKRWKKRYKTGGKEALGQFYKPSYDPFCNKISDEIKAAITHCKKEHPTFNGNMIIEHLNLTCSRSSVYQILKEDKCVLMRETRKIKTEDLFNTLVFSVHLVQKIMHENGEIERLYLLQVHEVHTGLCFIGFTTQKTIEQVTLFLKYIVKMLAHYNFTVKQIKTSRHPQYVAWEKELNRALKVHCQAVPGKEKRVGKMKHFQKIFADMPLNLNNSEELILNAHTHLLEYNHGVMKQLKSELTNALDLPGNMLYYLFPFFIDTSLNIQPAFCQKKITSSRKDQYLQTYVKYLYDQAKYAYSSNENEHCLEYCKKGMKAAGCLNRSEVSEAEILIQEGLLYLKIGKPAAAGICFNHSLHLGKAVRNKERIAEAYYFLGYLIFSKGYTDKALEHYNKALEVYKHLENHRKICIVGTLIVNVYKEKNQCDKALPLAIENMEAAEELKDYKQIFATYNTLAGIYLRMENYIQAKKYYNIILSLAEYKKDTDGLMVVKANLGLLYFRIDDYSQAIIYYKEELNLAIEIGSKSHVANALLRIGNFYSKRERFEIALYHYTKAYEKFELLNDKFKLMVINEYLGKLYQRYNKFRNSLSHFNKMLSIAEEVRDSYTILRASTFIEELKKNRKN